MRNLKHIFMIKKLSFYSILISLMSPLLLISQTSNLQLTGIMDFTVPSGGSNGKAIHVTALDTIADLSIYGIGVANNGVVLMVKNIPLILFQFYLVSIF